MPSTKLIDAMGRLVEGFLIGRMAYEQDHPGKKLIITCTNRSTYEQQALFAQGRTKPGPIVTQIDGVTKKSNHNFMPSLALDFAVLVNGTVNWADVEFKIAGPYFVAQRLVWGGNWISFKDYAHIELPAA